MSRIYLSPPDVRPLERELVVAAIDSNWVAPIGPDLNAFEHDVATVTGVATAVGLSSGTAALHLALLQLGVGHGDYVFVSSFTFAATANAVTYVGATPVFIDSEATTWGMSPELVKEELMERSRTGTLPKAAIIVDLYGQCADYDRLLPLFNYYNIAVIEDAAEALGATYRGKPAGSFGDFGVISFNGNKIITCGGGGMLLCHNDDQAARVRHLATQAREPFPHYEHLEIGYNYRLSNILAAFGRGQLTNLPERITRRQKINDRYRRELSTVTDLSFMPIADFGEPNWWLTCVTIDTDVLRKSPEDLRCHLETYDIESRPVWKPMHLQPVFADSPSRIDGTSEDIFAKGLCFPSGSGMTDGQLDEVIAHTLDFLLQ